MRVLVIAMVLSFVVSGGAFAGNSLRMSLETVKATEEFSKQLLSKE